MQIFELIILIGASLYLLFAFFWQSKKSPIVLPIILIIGLCAHLIFEGYRWQMVPGYLISIIAFIRSIKSNHRPKKRIVQILMTLGIFILFMLSYLLGTMLPVFKLPEPSGKYQVGTNDIYLTFDRPEVITKTPNDKRKIAIKTWYPTSSITGEKDRYVDEGGRHGFAMKYGLPKSAFNYLDKIDTHVFKNSPIVDKEFPVLIFSHGYNSKANSYYSTLSNLASQGYIIFALNHSYESTGSTFEDGSEIYFDYEYFNEIQKDTWHIMEPLLKEINAGTPVEKRHSIAKKTLTTYFVKDMVERWTQDISDLITNLDSMNSTGLFKNKLDLKKIGVLGHSRGGGAAGNALLKDNRINAGVNIDGVQWGEIVNTQFDKPFLYISADWPESHENLNLHTYINKSSDIFYEAKILNSAHCNFMDIPFMIPNRTLSQAGSINPEIGIKITNDLLKDFFDKHLKNKPIVMDELTSSYDLLELKTYSGAQ